MKNSLVKEININCYPQWMEVTQNIPEKIRYRKVSGFDVNTKVEKSGIDKLLIYIRELLYEQYGFNDD